MEESLVSLELKNIRNAIRLLTDAINDSPPENDKAFEIFKEIAAQLQPFLKASNFGVTSEFLEKAADYSLLAAEIFEECKKNHNEQKTQKIPELLEKSESD